MIATQLTPDDIAKILSISISAAYVLCNDPDFPAYKVRSGQKSNWRVDPVDFKAWQQQRKDLKAPLVEQNMPAIRKKARTQKQPAEQPKVYNLNWG